MKRLCSLILLSLFVAFGGCLSKSKQKTPEIAQDVEESFKQRWIAKRMSELQASGVTEPREARRQATDEFRKKYEYINASRAPDPMTGPTP